MRKSPSASTGGFAPDAARSSVATELAPATWNWGAPGPSGARVGGVGRAGREVGAASDLEREGSAAAANPRWVATLMRHARQSLARIRPFGVMRHDLPQLTARQAARTGSSATPPRALLRVAPPSRFGLASAPSTRVRILARLIPATSDYPANASARSSIERTAIGGRIFLRSRATGRRFAASHPHSRFTPLCFLLPELSRFSFPLPPCRWHSIARLP